MHMTCLNLLIPFHSNNKPSAKEILDKCSIEVSNIDIQIASYLNLDKRYDFDVILERKNNEGFFLDRPDGVCSRNYLSNKNHRKYTVR